MKYVVAGTFQDCDVNVINYEISKLSTSEIIVGDLVTSDDVKQWADCCGRPKTEFHLDFDQDKFSALQMMSFRMVLYADGVIIFNDNTQHHKSLLKECMLQSKPVIDHRRK